MKKFLLVTTMLALTAGASFAGNTKFDEALSGETCERVEVLGKNGNVLYTYRADPSCGNVRTGNNVDFVTTFVPREVTRNVEREVKRDVEREEVKARGVADGATHNAPNLTSMGVAKSDGKTIVRVRTTQEGTVVIKKAGGGVVFDGNVGKGDTLVEVPGGGTYIAEVEGKKITKATGPQEFNDVQTVVDTVTETVVDTVTETVIDTVVEKVVSEDNGG